MNPGSHAGSTMRFSHAQAATSFIDPGVRY
jgi:hypothetical protein